MATRLKYLLKRINYWLLLVPFAATFVFGFLIYHDVMHPTRAIMEPLALAVLGFSFAVCLLRLTVSRHVFFIWATALAGVLLMREIHFQGTSEGVYAGLLLLVFFALQYFERLKDFLAGKTLLTLLAMGFFTYFFSQTIDQRWWRWFPGEDAVNVELEETLEVLGHCIIGCALMFGRKVSRA